MATKLFVGGLPYSTTEDELKELFSKYGEVESAIIIFDREQNRSKGFGFVELDDDSAQKAIDELNGNEFSGRRLTVNKARPQQPRQ